MPKIDLAQAPRRTGSSYPAPFAEPCRARTAVRLAEAAGLTQFGVNLVELPPGAWSSQRHWHTAEDEFVWVVRGEVVLVTDGGETVLRAGECAAFPAGDGDGHHAQNRSTAPATLLVVGTRRDEDRVAYPDIDLISADGAFRHRDGSRY